MNQLTSCVFAYCPSCHHWLENSLNWTPGDWSSVPGSLHLGHVSFTLGASVSTSVEWGGERGPVIKMLRSDRLWHSVILSSLQVEAEWLKTARPGTSLLGERARARGRHCRRGRAPAPGHSPGPAASVWQQRFTGCLWSHPSRLPLPFIVNPFFIPSKYFFSFC